MQYNPTRPSVATLPVPNINRATLSAAPAASNSPYLGGYSKVPKGLRRAGEDMRSDVLARLSRVLGVNAHEALVFDASLCVAFAYVNWYLDDRTLDYARAMPFEWSEEMAHLPIAERTAAYGLVDPYSVPVYDLTRWIRDALSESDVSDAGIFPTITGQFDSPVGIQSAADAGKVAADDPQAFPRKQQALFFQTSNKRSFSSYDAALRNVGKLDAIHTISAGELASITGIDQSVFDQWLNPSADAAVQAQQAHAQLSKEFDDWQMRFARGLDSEHRPDQVGQALVDWIDSGVAHYLAGKCDMAYKADPEHFPRFSTVFDIYNVLVTPTHEPGQAVILAKVTARRDQSLEQAAEKQYQEDQAAANLAAAVAAAASAVAPASNQPRRSWLNRLVSNWQ